MLTILSARVITPDGIHSPGSVILDGERIAEVMPGEPQHTSGEVLDGRGSYLAPGFIDIHVHGGDGADFMDATRAAFERITSFHATHGVTALQATTTAAPLPDTLQVLQVARDWSRRAPKSTSQLLGVHLEGPFLSVGQRGAHRADFVRPPSPEELERLFEFAEIITEVTLAPELRGAPEAIREFATRGILVSAGHSTAREGDVVRAIESGLRHTTHIFSGMSTVVKEGPYRIPGLLETTLASDDLTTEMIADGKHLPPTLMKLVLKCKGLDSVCLVSDAMRGAGMAEGEVLSVAGQEAVIEDGVAVALDHTHFAGSVTPLDGMVRNMVTLVGLSVQDAVQLVTLNPARLLGIQTSKGTIEPGKDADLVMLDEDLRVERTWIRGRTVFSALETQ